MQVVEKKESKSNSKERVEAAMKMISGGKDPGSRLALIQQRIPLGLMAVEEILQEEVRELAGRRYHRDESPNKRWGSNTGSGYLGAQKHSISVPRIRNQQSGREVPLKNYRALQSSQAINEATLAQVINGISMRKFEKAATRIPSTFGIQKSSISRKFIQATAKKLKAFQDRDLSSHQILVIFMDGKSFAENEMGITLKGEKIVLGAIESSTEKESMPGFFSPIKGTWLTNPRQNPVCNRWLQRLAKRHPDRLWQTGDYPAVSMA